MPDGKVLAGRNEAVVADGPRRLWSAADPADSGPVFAAFRRRQKIRLIRPPKGTCNWSVGS